MLSERIKQKGETALANTSIREEMKRKGVKQWEVAENIGIAEFTLSRWFRHELTGDRLERVRKAIEQIVEERGAVNACQH